MNCAVGEEGTGMDEARVNITVAFNETVQVWTQSTECDQCSLLYQQTIGPFTSRTLNVNTTFETIVAILRNGTNVLICQNTFSFGEAGEYVLEVSPLNVHASHCDLHLMKRPINSNLYVLWAFLFFVGLAFIWILSRYVYRKKFKRVQEDQRLLVSDIGSPSERNSNSPPWCLNEELSLVRARERLKSLDTFRGFCVILMIFVNYGGGKYWFFQHSKWNGLTVADLVFPWFMWIMGVSVALSMQSQLRKAITKKKLFLKIIKRSVILFSLELMLNTKYGLGCNLSEMRITGVLQRFAIAYLVVATLQLLSERPGEYYEQRYWSSLRDVLPYWPQWIFMGCVVAAHTLITFLLPVPGCPRGYLGPGGLHMNSSYPNCTGGAAGYVDRLVFGEAHMYRTPTCRVMYQTTMAYDPEGILGYLTAFFMTFLGLQAGKIVVMFPQYQERMRRWILWAILTGVVGTLLCRAEKNGGWIPVNKNLWSLSYVLVTASMAFVLLLMFYALVDVKHWWSGAPFTYSGANAILLYVGHEITQDTFPWSFPVANTHAAQLCMDLWGAVLWALIAFWLHRERFFLAI